VCQIPENINLSDSKSIFINKDDKLNIIDMLPYLRAYPNREIRNNNVSDFGAYTLKYYFHYGYLYML